MRKLAYAALWLFVFALPWEGIIQIGGFNVATRVAGVLALALALPAVLISGRVRRWHPFHIAALLFVIWAGGDQLFFHYGESLPSKFLTYVQLLLVLWMIWELAVTWQRVLGLLIAYVLGAYVAAIDTLLLYQKEAGVLRRFAAGGGDPNELAMTLALAVPMAWYVGMVHRKALIRWLGRGYLPLGVVAIGLTGSRGGLVVTLVALLIIPLTMTKLSPGRIVLAIAVLGISGALAAAYIPETIVKRLATTGTEVEDARFGGRFKLWVAGVDAFTKRPIKGYGTSSFILATKPRLGSRAQVAHNSYLSLLVEQGLVGFLLYMTMFVAVFLAILNLPQMERRFALILFAAVALAMSPLTWEDRKSVWVIMATLLGLAKAAVVRYAPAMRDALPYPAQSMAGATRAMRPPGSFALPGRKFRDDTIS